jgi:hypothetical protein
MLHPTYIYAIHNSDTANGKTYFSDVYTYCTWMIENSSLKGLSHEMDLAFNDMVRVSLRPK